MTNEQKTEVALFRFSLINPLFNDELSSHEKTVIRKKIISQKHNIPYSKSNTISDRTMSKYTSLYRQGGFNKLFPQKRIDEGQNRTIDEKLKEEILFLRKKNMEISCMQFYNNLIKTGLLSSGQASLNTIYRILSKNNLSNKIPIQLSDIKDKQIHWMQKVLCCDVPTEQIREQIGDIPELNMLLDFICNGTLKERKKAVLVLAYLYRVPNQVIYSFLGINERTFFSYIKILKTNGINVLFKRPSRSKNYHNDEVIKQKVFTALHRPPSDYGFNRTTWKMQDLIKALSVDSFKISKQTISKIIKNSGFQWRKARIALTSPDPEYQQKLEKIQTILLNLKSDELFFSIDEYGPFAIKQIGGKMLISQSQENIIPQWQKSKGSLIITAGLELSTNIITHFYSTKKNTDEMIKMMDILVDKYKTFKKLYLSWDVASWHVSKKLYKHIEENNSKAVVCGGCMVETAPLPSSSQFLNVIESVFSGMARAIIHNSDYESTSEAMVAIDRYFEERNTFFRENPKRAGKKIWGKERVPSVFVESNNCKDPKYR